MPIFARGINRLLVIGKIYWRQMVKSKPEVKKEKKWKYPDPKITGKKSEKWYDNVPKDTELENYIYALINRHSVQANSNDLSCQQDAALVPLLMKLVYIWRTK
jgi:hypothetical protein